MLTCDMQVVFGVAKLKKDGTPGKVMTLPSSLELQVLYADVC
jgi:hypothetical protein